MLKSTVRPTGEEELDDYIKDLVEITIKMMVCALSLTRSILVYVMCAGWGQYIGVCNVCRMGTVYWCMECVQDGDSILVYVMCAGWGQYIGVWNVCRMGTGIRSCLRRTTGRQWRRSNCC